MGSGANRGLIYTKTGWLSRRGTGKRGSPHELVLVREPDSDERATNATRFNKRLERHHYADVVAQSTSPDCGQRRGESAIENQRGEQPVRSWTGASDRNLRLARRVSKRFRKFVGNAEVGQRRVRWLAEQLAAGVERAVERERLAAEIDHDSAEGDPVAEPIAVISTPKPVVGGIEQLPPD